MTTKNGLGTSGLLRFVEVNCPLAYSNLIEAFKGLLVIVIITQANP